MFICLLDSSRFTFSGDVQAKHRTYDMTQQNNFYTYGLVRTVQQYVKKGVKFTQGLDFSNILVGKSKNNYET